MRLFLAVLALFALASCGGAGVNGSANSDATARASEAAGCVTLENTDSLCEAAGDSLSGIYKVVFAWYTRAENDGDLLHNSTPDFEKLYMSADYNAVYRRVCAADSVDAEHGVVGFFDYDHWVCGQDFQGLSAEVRNVSPCGDGKLFAKVAVTNCGTVTLVGVSLVREGGRWKIDDFLTEGKSEKARMSQYLKEK